MLDALMLPAITSLLALQDLDTRAEDARRRLADAPVRIDALDAKFDAKLDATAAQYPHGSVGHEQWAADDCWCILAPFATAGPLSWRIGGSKADGTTGYYGELPGAFGSLELSDA